MTDLVASRKFRKFAKDAGRPRVRDAVPVALLPEDVRGLLGSTGRIVRFSSDTAAKQQAHRQGQGFSPNDYRRAQRMLDEGEWVSESATHMSAVFQFGGAPWKAVIKQLERARMSTCKHDTVCGGDVRSRWEDETPRRSSFAWLHPISLDHTPVL